MRRTDGRACRALVLAAALGVLACHPAQAQVQSPGPAAAEPMEQPDQVDGWPKFSLETVAAAEVGGMSAKSGPDRSGSLDLRFDSIALLELDDSTQLDAFFQYKSKEPRPLTDPNRNLFSNQGAGRRNGGRFKELYLRKGDWRFGKFVQDFGRGFDLLPGPFATDLVEEPEDGYEPSEMWGVEKLHVFDDENGGWRQISVSAFMIDRTFLHETFPYNEGRIRYKDGGVGNTKLPENVMVTWDVLNQPAWNGSQFSYQASVIRWGQAYGAERGEWWTTLGGDINIPLEGTVEDTLRGRYSQLRFYVEAVRRDNFDGVAGRTRQFLSGAAEYLVGPWVFDLTTTQRWTDDRVTGSERDTLYTASIGYSLPSDTVAAISVATENVGGRDGVYAGLRLTQTLTSCSRCLVKGRHY
jgi:hypothetical protein